MANEQRLIDTSPNDCIRKVKRKTNFAKIVVTGTVEKPYFEIVWLDYMDREYHIGYGSYNLNFVFQWLSECFEVEDAPTVDAVEVVRCKDCKHWDKDALWCNINSAQFNDSNYTWYAENFCSYGERRTDDGSQA